MQCIISDKSRMDQGVMTGIRIDYDETDSKDFEITMPAEREIYTGGMWWYVENTGYGGIIDNMEVVSGEIKYTGRNFRGVMNSKILSPPPGKDYFEAVGDIGDIAATIVKACDMQDLFCVKKRGINIALKFDRYITLYDALIAICDSANQTMHLTAVQEKNRLAYVNVEFTDYVDYTGDYEFTTDDLQFRVKKTYNNVNHLICLGMGELKDRQVLHLYVDAKGSITDNQYYFGLEEIVEVYDYSSVQSIEELRKGGIKRLEELRNSDEFEVVTGSNVRLKVGDIIGGYEQITGIYVKQKIVNVIATIDDEGISLDYKVG